MPSAAARLLGLQVRIPPRIWMSVSREYCVLSGRVLCHRPISRPGESYCVCVYVIEFVHVQQKHSTPTMRRLKKSKKEGKKQGMKIEREKEERKKEFPLSVKQSSGGDWESDFWVFNRFGVSNTFKQ